LLFETVEPPSNGNKIDTFGLRQALRSQDPIAAADLLNDRVIPLFESYDVKLMRVLTHRGSEYCGNPERHEYELYLAVEDIDHTRTKTKSPQTNGMCKRLADEKILLGCGGPVLADRPFATLGKRGSARR
jgi:hypothetical protein